MERIFASAAVFEPALGKRQLFVLSDLSRKHQLCLFSFMQTLLLPWVLRLWGGLQLAHLAEAQASFKLSRSIYPSAEPTTFNPSTLTSVPKPPV